MDDEIKIALMVAAKALDIAADWNVEEVQVNPPEEWNLKSFALNANDGWCSTRELARKLRELSD